MSASLREGTPLERADATASMHEARAGRASYVRSEMLRGVRDPGAVAMSAVFDALASV